MSTCLVNASIYFKKYAKQIKINDDVVTLDNTCTFDAIFELFVHACREFEHFRSEIEKVKINSSTDYWNFVVKYFHMDEQTLIYDLRPQVLYNSKNCALNFLNCWTDIETQFREIYREGNAINSFKTRVCTKGCPVIKRGSTFLDPICDKNKERRFMELLQTIVEDGISKKIEDCGLCSNVKCCNVETQLGTYIMIEMEYIYLDNLVIYLNK